MMISLTTKAFLEESQILNLKIPDNVHLKTGEYEIVIVINPAPLKETKKQKLSFSEHHYCFENPESTFSRTDIFGDSGEIIIRYLLIQISFYLQMLLSHCPTGGKQIHDANIVATMISNDLKVLLTHNVADFVRFNKFITTITI